VGGGSGLGQRRAWAGHREHATAAGDEAQVAVMRRARMEHRHALDRLGVADTDDRTPRLIRSWIALARDHDGHGRTLVDVRVPRLVREAAGCACMEQRAY